MLEERPPIERATGSSDRCTAQTGAGQCKMRRLDGADYCQIHNGGGQLLKKQKESLYDFHKSRFLAIKDKHDHFKYDLTEELGVVRSMLQVYLHKVEDFESMMMYDGKIQNLLDRIQKLSDSVLKADQKLGTLMSEEDAICIAQGLIDVVHSELSEQIKDPEEFAAAMTQVGDKFKKVIAERGNTKS